MTTIRQLIVDAYREGGIVQIETEPSAGQMDEGLRRMQSFVSSLVGNELGTPLTDLYYGKSVNGNSDQWYYDKSGDISSRFVPANVRLNIYNTSNASVYLEPNPQEGARFAISDADGTLSTHSLTVEGNGKRINGASSLILNTNNEIREWFYRADLNQWVEITPLTLNSQSPFPVEFDELLSIGLAFRLNPRYRTSAAPESVQFFNRAKSQFRSRYSQTSVEPVEAGLYRIGCNIYSTTTNFNTGRVI